MQLWRTGSLAAAGLAALTIAAQVRMPARAQTEPTWRTDYAVAAAEARQSGKPLFVAFR